MAKKKPDDANLSRSAAYQRLYRTGQLKSVQLSEEEIAERQQKFRERAHQYYIQSVADQQARDEYNEKAKRFRAEHREENRLYMREYMREYRKKQAVKREEAKRLKELAAIEEKQKELEIKKHQLMGDQNG